MTNCINCGAPIHNNKCDYCGTEYTLDEMGRINEYKVKLNILGEDRCFYIGDIKVNRLFSDGPYRNFNGDLVANEIAKKIKLTLIEM